jgi:hypothetical protein
MDPAAGIEGNGAQCIWEKGQKWSKHRFAHSKIVSKTKTFFFE